jgi:hypothetical protein
MRENALVHRANGMTTLPEQQFMVITELLKLSILSYQ